MKWERVITKMHGKPSEGIGSDQIHSLSAKTQRCSGYTQTMKTWTTMKSATSELWAHINLNVTCSYPGGFPTNGIREIRVAWKNKQRRLLVPGITSCIQRSSTMGFQKAETDNTWSHYKEQHNVLHITAEAMKLHHIGPPNRRKHIKHYNTGHVEECSALTPLKS